jgi:hypothetical protein
MGARFDAIDDLTRLAPFGTSPAAIARGQRIAHGRSAA